MIYSFKALKILCWVVIQFVIKSFLLNFIVAKSHFFMEDKYEMVNGFMSPRSEL